jgi:hypothetical protein
MSWRDAISANLPPFREDEPRDLRRDILDAHVPLESAVLHDQALSHEFRVAMLRLCQAELGRGDVNATPTDADDRPPGIHLSGVEAGELASRAGGAARSFTSPMWSRYMRWQWAWGYAQRRGREIATVDPRGDDGVRPVDQRHGCTSGDAASPLSIFTAKMPGTVLQRCCGTNSS